MMGNKFYLSEMRFLKKEDTTFFHIPISFREYIGCKIAGFDCYIVMD